MEIRGRTWRKWEVNIKMDVTEIGYGDANWKLGAVAEFYETLTSGRVLFNDLISKVCYIFVAIK